MDINSYIVTCVLVKFLMICSVLKICNMYPLTHTCASLPGVYVVLHIGVGHSIARHQSISHNINITQYCTAQVLLHGSWGYVISKQPLMRSNGELFGILCEKRYSATVVMDN